MAVSFDILETCGPTQRSFTPGQYPTKRYEAISGSSSIRLYGSKAFDATMDLSFLMTDSDTASIVKAWHDSKGGFETLVLPSQFFDGASSVLAKGIPTYLNWRYAEPPSVESLFPGRSRVQIKLVATLDS